MKEKAIEAFLGIIKIDGLVEIMEIDMNDHQFADCPFIVAITYERFIHANPEILTQVKSRLIQACEFIRDNCSHHLQHFRLQLFAADGLVEVYGNGRRIGEHDGFIENGSNSEELHDYFLSLEELK